MELLNKCAQEHKDQERDNRNDNELLSHQVRTASVGKSSRNKFWEI